MVFNTSALLTDPHPPFSSVLQSTKRLNCSSRVACYDVETIQVIHVLSLRKDLSRLVSSLASVVTMKTMHLKSSPSLYPTITIYCEYNSKPCQEWKSRWIKRRDKPYLNRMKCRVEDTRWQQLILSSGNERFVRQNLSHSWPNHRKVIWRYIFNE